MPEEMCIGAIVSIPQKAQDSSLPCNHRGVYNCNIHHREGHRECLAHRHRAHTSLTPPSNWQFGISHHLPEAIANAVDYKEQVFPDSSKAFNVFNRVVLADTLNRFLNEPHFTQALHTTYRNIILICQVGAPQRHNLPIQTRSSTRRDTVCPIVQALQPPHS